MVLYFHFHFHFCFHFCFHGSSSFIISPHFHDDSSSDYWANSPPILTGGVESESSTMEKKEGSAVPLRVILYLSRDGLLSFLFHTASSWQKGNSRTVSTLSQSTASLVIWKFTDSSVFHVLKFCSIMHIEKFYLRGSQWNDFPPITENSVHGRQFKRDCVCFKLNSLAWPTDATFSSILLFDKLQS